MAAASLVLVVAGAFARLGAAAPSVESLGSDLSIVLHNDLYGNLSTRSEAVIALGNAQTYSKAGAICAQLSESLWAPSESSNATQSLDFLRSLPASDSKGLSGLYWIAAGRIKACRAISRSGKIQVVGCDERLPVLCTQTAALSTPSSIDASSKWQVAVRSGAQQYTGFRDKLSFRFQGVRYASQPERFTYSSVFEGKGNTSALAFGPQCVQNGCRAPSCSEDCLFLNIWTPYLPSGRARKALKPVVFWIHGGAFTGGNGADPTFDGGNMASRGDVVFIATNYRLSTLGFLALNDGSTKGNYGIADQITALQWVQRHVRDFGGDPSRITIVGQSAGAASVRALLASPKAKGLLSAAIPMSNLAGSNYAATYSRYYTIPEEVSVAANPILNLTGCANATSQVTCLRAYDPIRLASLSTVARYVVQDGTYINTQSLSVRANSNANRVPLLQGFMRDDGAAFTGYPSTTNLTIALQSAGFPVAPIINSGAYSTPNDANATTNIFNVTSLASTDLQFRCLDLAAAYSGVKNNVFPDTYFYEFNRSYQMRDYSPNFPVCNAPVTADRPFGDPSQEYFKCHSGELFAVFGTTLRQGYPDRDGDDVPFSQFALDTWASFARTNDPTPDLRWLEQRGYTNTSAIVRANGAWRKLDARNPRLRTLQAKVLPQKAFSAERARCEAIGYDLNWWERN